MTRFAINGQRWIAAATLALSAAFGYHRSWYRTAIIGEAFQSETLVLLVRNNNVSAARVFVGDGGSWKYVGPVRGRSADQFEVWSLAQSGAPLRLLATLNSARDTVRAGPLTVLSGQSVLLTLEQELSRSSAVVR